MGLSALGPPLHPALEHAVKVLLAAESRQDQYEAFKVTNKIERHLQETESYAVATLPTVSGEESFEAVVLMEHAAEMQRLAGRM